MDGEGSVGCSPLGKWKPLCGIVFAQGHRCIWWVVQKEVEIWHVAQRDLSLWEINPWFDLYDIGTNTAGITWTKGEWASRETTWVQHWPHPSGPGAQQSNMLLLLSWLIFLTDKTKVISCSYGYLGEREHGMGGIISVCMSRDKL